jgi:hypothetical protein
MVDTKHFSVLLKGLIFLILFSGSCAFKNFKTRPEARTISKSADAEQSIYYNSDSSFVLILSETNKMQVGEPITIVVIPNNSSDTILLSKKEFNFAMWLNDSVVKFRKNTGVPANNSRSKLTDVKPKKDCDFYFDCKSQRFIKNFQDKTILKP